MPLQIVNRVRGAWGALTAKATSEDFIRASLPPGNFHWTKIRTQNKSTEFREALERYYSWVYVCAGRNASACAMTPLEMFYLPNIASPAERLTARNYKFNGVLNTRVKELQAIPSLQARQRKAMEQVEGVTEHPLLDLLSKINPFENGFEYLEKLVLFLELCGNAFTFLAKDKNGVPVQLWLMPPQWVKIIPHVTDFIQEYRYGPIEPKVPFAVNDVVHFKYPNPKDQFLGWGPLQAAIDAVDTNIFYHRYEQALLENYARPDFILSTEMPVTQIQIDNIKAQWNKLYRGVRNQGKVAVLEAGLKPVSFNFSPREMAFLQGRQISRDEIAAAFGVPKSLIETKDVNRCYSEDTEILTEHGFKLFCDVGLNEKIATVNANAEIEYHVPNERFEYQYTGKMMQIATENVSLLVTPNHKIWRRTPEGSAGYGLIEASDLESACYVKASFGYCGGQEMTEVIIPAVSRSGTSNSLTLNGEIRLNADLFLEYLGYFLSEGGLLSHDSPNFRYLHTLSQKQGLKADKIRACLGKTGFSFSEFYDAESEMIRWNIYGKAVNSWFHDNCGGGAGRKRIPGEFKNVNARQLLILFDAIMLGDGSVDGRENRINSSYSTTSSRLADDVQEIAIKLGKCASKAVAYLAQGNRSTCYVVHICARSEHNLHKNFKTETDWKSAVQYDGKVWCFDVPNHIFITRRDGKIGAHGNSNSETGEYVYAKYTVLPRLRRIEQKLNESLVWPYFGDQYFVAFCNPVGEDKNYRLEEIKVHLETGYASINEERSKENREAAAWGEGDPRPKQQAPLAPGKPVAGEPNPNEPEPPEPALEPEKGSNGRLKHSLFLEP